MTLVFVTPDCVVCDATFYDLYKVFASSNRSENVIASFASEGSKKLLAEVKRFTKEILVFIIPDLRQTKIVISLRAKKCRLFQRWQIEKR